MWVSYFHKALHVCEIKMHDVILRMSTKSKFTYTATHHSLQVHLRVPITVIQNHNICHGQIDPQTTCPGAQHENKLFTSRHVIYALIADCLSSCGVCPSRQQYSNPFHRQQTVCCLQDVDLLCMGDLLENQSINQSTN